MAEEIKAFKTNDGLIFENYTAARVHEESVKYKPEIDAFLDSEDCPYKSTMSRSIAQRTVLAFLFWKADGGMNK